MVDFKKMIRRRIHVHKISPHEVQYATMQMGDVDEPFRDEDGREWRATEWTCSQCPETFLELRPKE